MKRLRSVPGQRQSEASPARSVDELWAAVAGAASPQDAAGPYLELQCRMVRGVRHGLIVLGASGRGPFEVAAAWPESEQSPAGLLEGAEQAIARKRGVISGADEAPEEAPTALQTSLIAQPLEIGGKLSGAIVLELIPRPGAELRELLGQLRWGSGWLDSAERRAGRRPMGSRKDRVELIPNLLVATVEQEGFEGAARAFVTDLAAELRCDRVSVGFLSRGRAKVLAISHTSHAGKGTNLIRAIEAAMDEAIDQEAQIAFPARDALFPTGTHAHADLAREHGGSAVCTVPIVRAGKVCGALTFERPEERPFDEQSLQVCDVAAGVVAPLLEILRREERWIGAKLWESLKAPVQKLVGPRHVALKLAAASLATLLLALLVVRADYRVTADAVLEPAVLRVAAAPYDAYLAEAPVRPGDQVAAGDLLGRLDDRDLRLERIKWTSEREQLLKRYRQALASRDAGEIEIYAASLQEAEAELERIEDLLSRTELRAPFDGIVITGDLSQELGAPVEKGAVLFEVAPLDAYRVILEVDESDVADVAQGQQGDLIFASLPSDSHRFEVEQLTPIANAEEGSNFFRVEARLLEPSERLRPAFEGVAKIEIEPRSLIWIWTHDVIDWFRLALWRWLP